MGDNFSLLINLMVRNYFWGITKMNLEQETAIAENFTPQKWEVHVTNFRPKNDFKVKFQTQEHGTHGLRMQTWQVPPGVNSAFGFPAICSFLEEVLLFQKLLGWGEGGTSISTFYSVKLCIIETRIHNTLLDRGSCDLTPIFCFRCLGTVITHLLLLPVSLCRLCY